MLTTLPTDVVDALTAAGKEPASADLWIRPGVVGGPKSTRHEETGDELSIEQVLALPASMRSPLAVFLDKRSGNVLFILPGEGERRPQIAVTVDFKRKVRREAIVTNMIVSALRVRLTDLRGRIKGDQLQGLLGQEWIEELMRSLE